MLYDTLPVPFQIFGFVFLAHAGRGRTTADLHFDLRQPVFHFPLLLGQFGVQGEVLRLDRVESLPQPFDFPFEGFVGPEQGRCTGRFDMG